ncbi:MULTISPECIES: RluA family pseudouridine synthase [unclassified Enterococcus]|uniref:RluA family pseudouridine synthase n=1 Tax=unclassified Enterococcus TaxID=2608891 RepID=UPI0015517A43|nr:MULTISPECIES: RluA family pseudouridine synthase [unclassified Enterococcus]MBS7577935.1 RluA family pseudouridine synthase [Enterococcus sp. MMGLQ5-2]MBS7585204.1 RluA family pseudouridine synthase [Enterococcus sp. MMGLQ5-1]NPD13061.1 RluA family pseudouridine synthase [Enterococcus sp. MMGLQ5-1]NPD37765.1 RluA family pseudouridine synthase [Enterococcus sp. MMGLQ5-2]
MELTIKLPESFQTKTIKTLLEIDWLVPRKVRHLLRTRKAVTVNSMPIKWHEMVKANDLIGLSFEKDDYPERMIPFGNPKYVEVLYEDQYLIIVNKPEHLKTHGNQPNEIALQNHVAAYLNQMAFVVHRLDMETSGAVLFAKNQFILPILGRLLEQRSIKRTYLALVEGQISEPFTIDDKIGRDRHDRRKRVISPNSGQAAITHIQPIQAFNKQSLVQCQLETGRTHQIRVHLSSKGYPIVGDPLYHPMPKGRLMLHAKSLSLPHPFLQTNITAMAQSQTFNEHLQ